MIKFSQWDMTVGNSWEGSSKQVVVVILSPPSSSAAWNVDSLLGAVVDTLENMMCSRQNDQSPTMYMS